MKTWTEAFGELQERIKVLQVLPGNKRTCKKCVESLPLSEFEKNSHTKVCKACWRIWAYEYYHGHRDAILQKRRLYGSHIRLVYNLTPQNIEAMLKAQNNNCALCGKPFLGKYVVDHCHKTGKVRGLLHQKCNTMLGFLETNPDLVTLTDAYLRKFKGTPVAAS